MEAVGVKAIAKPVPFRDLRATMLYQMGLDQQMCVRASVPL
jgi:hypothetical protein